MKEEQLKLLVLVFYLDYLFSSQLPFTYVMNRQFLWGYLKNKVDQERPHTVRGTQGNNSAGN